MSSNNWYPIPGYSRYEINCEGLVRISINSPIADERGELIRLGVFIPDKSQPHKVVESYILISDKDGVRTVRKQVLLELINEYC